ncbi:hypothetical protein CCMA1212_006868 [Trichoderma ghanense]|uniref:Secreted protein n=1 Tax=Trichoderma ghanense TaxID=65468 RepID=A0ABY2H2A2_9HYPO
MIWPWTGITRLGCALYCSVPFFVRCNQPWHSSASAFVSVLFCPSFSALLFSSRPCLSPTATELRGPSCGLAS